MFSGQFYEKRLSGREINMNLLLDIVTDIAKKERVFCIITMDTVMCIMHCRKYHLHNCNRDSYLHNYNKNCHPHICVTCTCAAENRNCIIATATVTCIIVTERSINIPVTESTTSKPAKMQQMLSLA